MLDTYVIYVAWCLDHHRTPPTREWWNAACTILRIPTPRQPDIDFDYETERREGWAND